jgi:hypothetical protein
LQTCHGFSSLRLPSLFFMFYSWRLHTLTEAHFYVPSDSLINP